MVHSIWSCSKLLQPKINFKIGHHYYNFIYNDGKKGDIFRLRNSNWVFTLYYFIYKNYRKKRRSVVNDLHNGELLSRQNKRPKPRYSTLII